MWPRIKKCASHQKGHRACSDPRSGLLRQKNKRFPMVNHYAPYDNPEHLTSNVLFLQYRQVADLNLGRSRRKRRRTRTVVSNKVTPE
ncbi:hypothetical protein Mapa_005309 [Marchantia paleacea]|nr:hypothetical protein Mapa_005309 [Marchantia paleacea]